MNRFIPCYIAKIPLFLLVLFPTISFGQSLEIDSLQEVLSTSTIVTERIDLLNKIGFKYYRIDLQKTYDLGSEALELSEKIDYPKGKAGALNVLAIYYDLRGDPEKSIANNMECLAIAESIQNYTLASWACNDMAIIHERNGDTENALKLYQKSIAHAIEKKDSSKQIVGLGNIGSLHANNGNKEEAKEYFNRALAIGKQSKKADLLIWCHQIIGEMHFEENELTAATEHFTIAKNLGEQLNDKTSLSEIKISQSLIYLKQDKTELAILEGNEARSLAEEIGDFELLLWTNINLMEIYQKTQKTDQAIRIGQKGLELAKTYKYIEQEMVLSEELAQLYAEKENYEAAFNHHQFYLNLRDSLFSDEKIKYVSKLEKQYQTKQKESENVLLKAKQNEQLATIHSQKMLNNLLGLITLLVALLGFFIFRAYRLSYASRELLEEKVKIRTQELEAVNLDLLKSNEELESFSYIASHDLKEPLRNINSFTALLRREVQSVASENAKEYMSYILKNTQQMNMLIQDVLEYSSVSKSEESIKTIDLNEVIQKITGSFSQSIKEKTASIYINQSLPHLKGRPSKVYFLFKNIIENGIRYNENANPEIRIDLKKEGQFYIFSIADNGIGIEPAYHKKIFEMFKRLHTRMNYTGSGLGLSLCKKIVHNFEGEIWLDSKLGQGTTFYFSIPVDNFVQQEKETQASKEKLENTH